MFAKRILLTFFCIAFALVSEETLAQCAGKIMEPGFAFLSSSRGCAPFTAQIQTLFLASDPGTKYFVNWGDGTPEETFTQVVNPGVTISHAYPVSPTVCGYDIIIDAENTCNPRGSVVPIQTQVVVWTNDVVTIAPGTFRVCQGFAADIQFTDGSAWNCHPRATRDNAEGRWIQWLYNTGTAPPPRIPGVLVDGIVPTPDYTDPAPGMNPKYPVLNPGETSLPIHVPVTTAADLGKEFEVTLKNWNQCNPYDEDLTDSNPFNPVNNDLVNGDNAPQIGTANIVIVPAPQPAFDTKLGDASGPIQTTFCINEDIFFDNNTPGIPGSSFQYTWEFYNNGTGAGAPAFTGAVANQTRKFSTAGLKLIRLRVKDKNAAGGCEALIEKVITISPSLTAKINITNTSGVVITPDFCQEVVAPYTNFQVRFNDVSVGTVTANTRWRWELYDQNKTIFRNEPNGGGFSATQISPVDQNYTVVGFYGVKLFVKDNSTACVSEDSVTVRVFEKPKPDFTFNSVCEGSNTTFNDVSTLNSIGGQKIISREWDMNYDGVTFNKEAALDNQTNFSYNLGAAGSYKVALRITTDLGGCSDIFVQTVIVDAKPVSSFTIDKPSGCSVLNVTLTNTSIGAQPPAVSVKQYIWEVDDGSGYKTDLIQDPNAPGFTPTYVRKFANKSLVNKVYNVRLRVTTVNNCETLSSPTSITVFPGPASGFVSANYSPFDDNCSPLSVNFTVDAETQSLNPTNYLWEVRDASGVVAQQNGANVNFSYQFTNNTVGIVDYRVTLSATLASNCTGDSTRIIRVNPVPISDFTVTELPTDCTHKKYHFEAVQKGLVKYSWTLSINGTPVQNSSTDQFDYEFTRSGTGDLNVSVDLQTTNFANCVSTITTNTLVVPQQTTIDASFTANPLTQTWPNATVTLTRTVVNPPTATYLWEFGDKTKSTDGNLTSHTYTIFGTYTVKLTVFDGLCSVSAISGVQIYPAPPDVDFDFGPAEGCSPLVVTFTNKTDPLDSVSYFWKFGNNQGFSNEVNPTYVYNDPGVYTVTLTATNSARQSTTIEKGTITVHEKPQAGFALKPLLIYIPGGKLFTRNESFGAESYYWDFGDFQNSTEFEPQHVYTEPGTYNVTLIVATSFGCVDTAASTTGVKVMKGGELLIPNAFSPNTGGPGSNGQNDRFAPLMRGVTEYKLSIFNRWGQLLFETKNPEDGWDGYFNGKLCQQDVYVYKITAKYENGQTVTKVGDVNLIR